MGRKASDWFTVSLCRDHHTEQHTVGERTFWKRVGIDVEALIEAFCRESPKALEIQRVKRERASVG